MVKKIIISTLFLLVTAEIFSQDAAIFRLTPEDLSGMEEKRWNTYNENNLWGYINGGADLYLEYGFSEVSAQDFTWENEAFKVDVYTMSSPEAAFGIFSVSRHGCSQSVKIAEWCCVSQYHVQIAQGNTYLSVVSLSGSEKGNQLAQQIAAKLKSRISGDALTLPSIFTDNSIDLKSNYIKLITGQLALQNAYPNLEEIYSNILGYSLWVVPFEMDSLNHTLMISEFSSEKDQLQVYNRFQNTLSDSFQSILISKNRWLLTIRTKGKKLNPAAFEPLVKKFDAFCDEG